MDFCSQKEKENNAAAKKARKAAAKARAKMGGLLKQAGYSSSSEESESDEPVPEVESADAVPAASPTESVGSNVSMGVDPQEKK